MPQSRQHFRVPTSAPDAHPGRPGSLARYRNPVASKDMRSENAAGRDNLVRPADNRDRLVHG
ncbi:hypothetical protein ACIBCD_30185 [Nocardia brasiliensis]|uniref:hypothetical protein n=1 Tax=Nocardia brasiliensis TaxID=37326 RepID=UPI0024588A12|nr:hypothetical protein [Nocardia brasiliensis]